MKKADWSLTQADLGVAEEVLTELSSETRWKVVGDMRYGWPARRLWRRRGLEVQQIRVRLSEHFATPEERNYVVDRVAITGFGPWRREQSFAEGRQRSGAWKIRSRVRSFRARRRPNNPNSTKQGVDR